MRGVRRSVVAERYRSLIDALYSGPASVHMAAQVRYEDGRLETVSADLKIGQAPTFDAAPAKAVA